MHDRLALSVLNMGDALFKAYGGAGYTHSAGGGLLQPQDFHGMAALLVEARPSRDVGPAIGEQGSRRRQRAALERLRDPIHGNPIIEETLTCLERELNGSQPLLHEESSDSDDASDESDDERHRASRRQRQRAAGTQSALARPPPFVGAAVSVLPLPQAADHERVREEQIIGDKRPRDARGRDDDLAQAAASDEPMTSPDNAAHTVLFPRGSGGFVQRQNACSRHHYVQKKLGSVAYVYGRAQEFVWYHFQMIVEHFDRIPRYSSIIRVCNPATIFAGFFLFFFFARRRRLLMENRLSEWSSGVRWWESLR